jgi:formate-dependent nitrite reductase membrane component NrfD
MVEKFTTELHGQREWAWLLALYLFFGSLGGSLYLLYRVFHLPPVLALVSLGLVLLGAGTIWFKLGSPQRVWRAILRPTTSWISRGVLFVSGFLAFGALSVAPLAEAWIPSLSPLLWSEGSALGQSLSWAASLLALLTAIYPGLVVSSSPAIPFWNTPMLPVLFFAYAVMGAVGIVLIGSPNGLSPIVLLAAWLIVINFVLVSVYLFAMNQAGGSAQESVRRLNQGPLGAVFWIGVVAGGLIFPLVAVIWIGPGGPLAGVCLPLAGVCLLLGGLLLRYCVLKAGVYVPTAIALAKVDFSKLNRTSANLEREYSAWQITHPAAAKTG